MSNRAAPTFAEVYEQCASLVLRTVQRLGVRDAEVEDVAQEVFVVIHRRLPEYLGQSSLSTWVYGICLRVSSDWRRRAHVRRETVVARAPDRSTSGETPLRQIALKQARQRLEAALEALDEERRSVFVLFELEGLSMKEVAVIADVPLKTAYSRLYAARAHVEAKLTQVMEPAQ